MSKELIMNKKELLAFGQQLPESARDIKIQKHYVSAVVNIRDLRPGWKPTIGISSHCEPDECRVVFPEYKESI